MKHLLQALLAFILAGWANAGAANPSLSAEQRNGLQKGYRHEKHGWIYLHTEGTPEERGFQHGYLLAREIAECLRVHRRVWEYQSAMPWSWMVEKSNGLVKPKVDEEDLTEIEGIVQGLRAAGVDSTSDELIAYNASIDLEGYWWPMEKKKMQPDSPRPAKQSCSSFIATGSMTADRGIVLGHNTMFDYTEAISNVIMDIVPAKGHRILMQTQPGWVHSGTDFFITDAGLVGSETTIGDFKGFDEQGIPEFVRFRRATQDASSIDEWCELMKKGNNGGYANAWLLGDVNSGEIARLELGLKYVGFEKKRDGFFAGSNVAEDLKILRFETERKETDIRLSSVARRVRWDELMKRSQGKIDLTLAKRFEADHFDTYLRKDYPGGRSLCGHFDLDPQALGTSIPFDPGGTFDAKVVDTTMAKKMSFAARWGSACGTPFDAQKFLAQHPQFGWMNGILKSRPSYPWTEFRAGEKK